MKRYAFITLSILLYFLCSSDAAAQDSISAVSLEIIGPDLADMFTVKEISIPAMKSCGETVPPLYRNIYAQPYSLTKNVFPKKGRMIANVSVLAGAFVSTLLVLECLPEDATSWNRAEIRNVSPWHRWYNHVIKEGPAWDHDKFYFNYFMHPYAGAVYFMAARSCGYGFWRSMLCSALISTIGWEFGIEACMERPSYQDLVITPVVGSCLGEFFYKVKRKIVSQNYTLAGSPVFGNIVAFVVDPVNEVVNLFRGSDTRRMHLGAKPKHNIESSFVPMAIGGVPGFTLSLRF